MYFRRSTIIKYLVALYLGAALYSEWFVYYVQPSLWVPLHCPNKQDECLKILFIADPQIQGDTAAPAPLHQLFSWDSDRYLKATFYRVMMYFNPDILIYMGDLMDEGSISTTAQYHNYVKRLAHIFDVKGPIMQIWLPGDNDIGGENEPVKRTKVEQFDLIFDQPSVLTFKNVSFYKINAITHTLPEKADWPKNDTNFKFALSHYPLSIRGSFGQKVNKEIRPDIYFCAHDHDSKFVRMDRTLQHRQTVQLGYGAKPLRINSSDQALYEINVPTCSYRMGTSKIGYGAAVLDTSTRQITYTVLWSPQRFPYLFSYLVILVLPLLYLLVFCSVKLIYSRSRVSHISVKGASSSPLLDKV